MPNKAIGFPREKKLGTSRLRRLTRRSKELLKGAQTWRQSHREGVWKRGENLYIGSHWTSADAGAANDMLVVNYAGSTINTIVPFVAANPPQFRVDPLGGEATVARAREQTAWLNRWWRLNDINGTAVLRSALFDYLVYGDGWLIPTWALRTEKDEESALFDTTTANLAVERVSPWDVWVDKRERWVIRRFLLSVEELKNDKQYHGTQSLTKSTTSPLDDRPVAQTNVGEPSDHERDQMVEVFEFYDLITDELLVFVDQLDRPIKFVSGIELPLVNLGNYVIPNSPYHMGELEQIDGLQTELNRTRSQMITHRRRNVQKFAARKGAITQEGITALKSEVVNDVVEIDDRGQDLKDVIVPLDVPLLTSDAYNSYEISKADMFEITGVSEYLRGSVPSGRRTATEANIIEGSNNVKTNHKLLAVEDALQKLGQLIIEVARDVFPLTDEDEVGMIITGREAQAVAASGAAGPEAAQDPSAVESVGIDPANNEGEMWLGEYQVFVEAASTELRDPFVREQKFRQLFTDIVGVLPVLQAQGINPDLRKMLELWFEAAGVEDFESIFATAGPPQRSPEELAAIGQGGNALGQGAGQPAPGNVGPPVDQPQGLL